MALRLRWPVAFLALLVLAARALPAPTLALFTGAASNAANSFSADVLNPPTSPTATGGSSISLSWSATVDLYATGYRVFRSTTSGGPYSQIAQITPNTTTTYTDTPAAGTYFYVVRSYFQNWESVNSGEVTATSATGISFDASSSCTPTSASTFTWSHTTSGQDRILIVGVAIRNSGSNTVSSVTYAGTALTLIAARNNGTSVRVELWRLVAPATGANNVVVTLDGQAKTACGAMSFGGVDQTSPIEASNSATGTSATPSVSVSTATNNAWVVDATAFRSSGNAKPTGAAGLWQTERWSGYTESGGSSVNIRGKGSHEGPKSPAGAVVIDWSLSASDDWSSVAAALKPTP